MSLFRRASRAATGGASGNHDTLRGSRIKDGELEDPLSLCGLARLLLAPHYRRRPPAAAPCPPIDGNGHAGGHSRGTAAAAAEAANRPETDVPRSPLPNVSKVAAAAPTGSSVPAGDEALRPLTFPTEKDKNEAARLLARAFSSAGGAMPPENVYFGEQAEGGPDNDDGIERARSSAETKNEMSSHGQTVLGDVHLVVSGFSLREARKSGARGHASSDGRGEGTQTQERGGDGAKEWHLREAASVSGPNTKTGILARCVVKKLNGMCSLSGLVLTVWILLIRFTQFNLFSSFDRRSLSASLCLLSNPRWLRVLHLTRSKAFVRLMQMNPVFFPLISCV